ncbi:MAG: riboflavin biosynthesis protein RibF [Sedimentisphaerales bacterium]|nr:riboflavin biosynthesis protein RibF [Sedimentisphaerales bacterium]
MNDYPRSEGGCVLSVGNFDGVHLGHQAIIRHGREVADGESLPLVGLTFDPAPVRLLRPDKAPQILSPLQIKTRMLEESGLDQLIIVETTAQFLSLSAEQFAEFILLKRIGARHVVEGQTFGFGKRRGGTVMNLQELGRKLGFEAHMTESFRVSPDGGSPVAVSSTLIRGQLLEGALEEARCCLGRYYVLGGVVVRGRGQGRRMGFPTANMELYHQDQLVPGDGVYAGFARLGDTSQEAWRSRENFPVAISIGSCETFDEGRWQVEAYLLDKPHGAGEFYEKHIMLSLVEKIRDQKRFETPEELRQAIENDCRDIEKVLQGREGP